MRTYLTDSRIFRWAVVLGWMALCVEPAFGASGGFAGAVEAAREGGGVVAVPEAALVSEDVTIGEDVHLRFEGAGRLEVGAGATVVIEGPLTAPLSKVFSGSGRATFGKGNTSIAQVYPQWWGAAGDGEHDDTEAIQAAIDAVREMGGGEVVITRGTFKTTETLYLWGVEKWDKRPDELGTRGIALSGLSRRASTIRYAGEGACLWLFTGTKDDVRYYHTGAAVRSLHLRGSDKKGTTGLKVSDLAGEGSTGGSTLVENCAIEHFDVGLHVEHSYGARFAYNKIRYNNTGVRLGSPAGSTYNINGNSFRDNEISSNRHIGVRIYGGDHNVFDGGLIEGNGDEGIYIEHTETNSAGYLTFRNIWIEANQRDKAAGDLGQAYVHGTVGAGYKAQRNVIFERCFFNCQGENYHIKLGNTIGLQLIYNQFGHPNDRIIYRMPDTYSAWAIVRTVNEDQNKVIQGVLAPASGAPGDGSRDDVAGTRYMPHVYFPANASKSELTSGIEADARTHSSIASASGVFTTQHRIGAARVGAAIALPKGAALIGLSVCAAAGAGKETEVRFVIDGKATSLSVTLPKGETAAYREFALSDYKAGDWVSGKAKAVTFDVSGRAAVNVVAFWRSNELPVF